MSAPGAWAGRVTQERAYLAAIAVFCNEIKGKSMLALSRDLGVSSKCAFVLTHKLRQAMAEELRGRVIGGEGKTGEVDSGYFGGYVKPANRAESAAPTARNVKQAFDKAS